MDINFFFHNVDSDFKVYLSDVLANPLYTWIQEKD